MKKWYVVLSLVGIMCLTACSTPIKKQLYTATGYISDQDSVRIWLEESEQHVPEKLYVIYESAKQNGLQQIFSYQYLDGQLFSIEAVDHHIQQDKSTTIIRLDVTGKAMFMEKQYKGNKSVVTPEDVNSLKSKATQLLKLVNILNSSQVKLLQGYYSNGQFYTCANKKVRVGLSDAQTTLLKNQWLQRTKSTSSISGSPRLGVAWLSSPDRVLGMSISSEDSLLLWRNEDLCQSQPAWYTYN